MVRKEVSGAAETIRARVTERLKDPICDGTVSVCLDMNTDDYRKQAYLDVHCNWIDRDFSTHHTALAVKHFGTSAHTGQNIHEAVSEIMTVCELSTDETPVTTDHC